VGRKPKLRDDAALEALKKEEGPQCFKRIIDVAKDRKLRKSSPKIYLEANKLAYESCYGKPSVSIVGDEKHPIRFTFKVISSIDELPEEQRPQQIGQSSLDIPPDDSDESV